MFITNKNIEASLVKSLQFSFTSQTNCEITLMCEGKKIKCHRHVLCLHSTHFKELFNDQNNFPSAIAVVNMKYNHLKAMMDYMYYGKIKLQENSEEVAQIIKCAGDLGLTALVNFIEEYLKTFTKSKQNGSNLSSCDLNGDIDSASKRKRASDVSARVNLDSVKKPKITESPLNQSTPLRDGSKSILKSSSTEAKPNISDNSESLLNDKKRKSDEDEADDDEFSIKRAKQKEEEEERKRKEAEKKKMRQEEEERKRKELEAELRKRAEEEKRKAAEEAKRKAEEEEKIRIEEEKKREEDEKKKKEEEQAKKFEEEKNKKETKCDDSATTKCCNVCNKEYRYNVEHKKVLEGVQFEKKCIYNSCAKPLKFRRSLIDHLLKEHKIDVCDG